jgi:hypothetical protein
MAPAGARAVASRPRAGKRPILRPVRRAAARWPRLARGVRRPAAVASGGSEPGATSTLLAVTLKRDTEQMAEIARILGELDIVVDGLSTLGATGAEAIVVRIPPDRVLEAVLSLNYHGFPEVRVYTPAARPDVP